MSEHDQPPTEDPRPDGLRPAKSLVIVNTGNGKGKSTAAFGVMVRGVARGWRVAVLQFIKSGDWKVGEAAARRRLAGAGRRLHLGQRQPRAGQGRRP
jgi:cob(I)alamin adenosyltransferase